MKNHVCPWWLAYSFDNPIRAFFHKPETILAPYLQSGMTVADIGCGFGYFTIGLARILAGSGQVIGVDLQPEMLEKAKKRAKKAGCTNHITFRQCHANDIAITEPLDFALAFWMAHETPDIRSFLTQIHACLKPSGLFLITEPTFHVSAEHFDREVQIAEEVGLTLKDYPNVKFSRSALLSRP